MSFKTKKWGKYRLKRAIKGSKQGRLIWLERLNNKTAFITSKHAYQSRIINKSQAKAYLQAIKRHITHKKEYQVAQISHRVILSQSNQPLKHYNHFPSKEKQGFQANQSINGVKDKSTT